MADRIVTMSREEIRILCYKKEKSIKAFAEKLGYNPNYMRQVLRGHKGLSERLLMRIADVYSDDKKPILQYFSTSLNVGMGSYSMPPGFECPICVRASADIKGVNMGIGEVYYVCPSCNFMFTVKKYIK